MAIFKFGQKPNMNLGKRIFTSFWSAIRCRRKKTEVEQKPYHLHERLPPWYQLYVEFTNRTTWHGLKYPCLPSRFKIRQILWIILLICNATLFLYIMTTNMIKLHTYPSSINVEVTYVDSVPFPAITVCNQNLYRLTAIQENGLYDYLVNGIGNDSLDENYCDTFQLFTDICDIPNEFRSDPLRRPVVYEETTRRACLSICVEINGDTCSGVLYHRRTRTCEISSYTGEWYDIGRTACGNSTTEEFYRRSRCNTNVTVRCNFEDGYCALSNDTNQKDQWTIVEAEGHPVETDNTLNLGSGHTLNLLLTDRRPGYAARLVSPYMNTANKCIELYYWLLTGRDPPNSEHPTLTVILIDEELEETTISEMKKGPSDWSRLFIQLPNGTNKVVIQGQRGQVGSSGIFLDDISILDCEYFEANRNCKSTRLGKGYMGSKSQTSDGHDCLPWDLLTIPLTSRLPDPSAKAAANYCRNIPEEKWTNPSCFIELSSGNVQASPCDIPFCDCFNSSYFRCKNGMCLPTNRLCNGVDECLDNSDELDVCKHKRNLMCRFEDDYMCGYTTTSIGNQRWTRLSSGSLAYITGNLVRSSVSALEQLMVIDSKLGQFKDQVQLISPLWTFDEPTLIELTYIMLPSSSPQSVAGLYLYQLSEVHSPVRLLFSTTSFTNTDLAVSDVCVPAGTYHLMFLGIQGIPYESVFGLDIVAFKDVCNETFDPIVESINCTFVDYCGYQFISTSAYFTSGLTESQNAFAIGNSQSADECNEKPLTGTRGTIQSPAYPNPYPNNLTNCVYSIEQPTGTTITIAFDDFDIEPENDCLADRLEITDVEEDLTRIYCGNTHPPPFVSKGNRVLIAFKTDETVNGKGFKLTYSTEFISKDPSDYIAIIKFSNEAKPANFYSHYARLISPPVALTTNSCLVITLVANANITLNRLFLNEAKAHSERVLFVSALPLGPQWNRIYVNLVPLPGNEKFAVALETAIGVGVDVAAAVGDITLFDGACRGHVTSGSLECNFTTIDQCGYLDDSVGTVNWARVYDVISTQNYMRAVFTRTLRNEAVLRSVTSEVNVTSCLRLNFYSSSANLFVAVTSSNSTATPTRSQLPAGNSRVYYTLEGGVHSLAVEVSFPGEVLDDPGRTFHEVRIYGTTMTEGDCSSKVSASNPSCNFDDGFACDYQPITTYGDPWNWVNFKNFLDIRQQITGSAQNTTEEHGNVMLFNGSASWREGVLVSPLANVSSPTGQRLTFEVFSTTSRRSTSLEILITNELDHVSFPVPTSTEIAENSWTTATTCLPPGVYRLVFVAYTTPGNYVAIDNVLMSGDGCQATEPSPPNSPECQLPDPLHCPNSTFIWSPKFIWAPIADIDQNTIVPGRNECVYFFNALNGIFTYDQEVKKSLNSSQCDIYIRGIGRFTVALRISGTLFNCDRQFVTIFRRENGILTNDNVTFCSELLTSRGMTLNFTTEDILQIHVNLHDGGSRFNIEYNYLPDNIEGYALALHYEGGAGDNVVTASRIAEWSSPVIPTKRNATICLRAEYALARYATLEVLVNRAENHVVTSSLAFSNSGLDPLGNDELLWRRAIFEIPIDRPSSVTQLVFYFSVSNATFGDDELFIGAIRNVYVISQSCVTTGGSGLMTQCNFAADDSCGFVDASDSTARWVIASNRSIYPTSGSCKVTNGDDFAYSGDVSQTVTGRSCQRWNEQSPHPHHQGVADYFPDATLNDSANFCRNPDNPFIPRTAWCYTMDAAQRREYCSVPHCLDYFMCAQFSRRTSSRAILMSSRISIKNPSCLHFRYYLTSTSVQLTVVIVSDDENNQTTFTADSEPTSIVWITGELGLTRKAREILFYADMVDVTDTDAYVTIDNVTITEAKCPQSVDKNSSSPSTRVPYLGPRVPYDTYKKFVLSDMIATDMQNLTRTLAHQMPQLIQMCDFVVEDCLQTNNFKTEFTDMGQCYTFNFDASNAYQINSTGAKSGLRLTLNIEQYEHVPEFGLGVGVKLFLHDQSEVPSMRNLGLSIPTAMNTLVSVTYTQTENMEPPYGKCGASNLTCFPSDEVYTEAKCLLQDKTTYYKNFCGCKDIYMPGSSPVCNFSSYFECVYTRIQDHLVPYTSECPPACTINSYSVEMSQAQLPGLDINKLYGNNEKDIQTRYLKALEVRNRVDDSLIVETLGELQGVIDATVLLKSYVYFGALDPATSFPAHVQTAMLRSGQIITGDILDTGASILAKFQYQYTANLKPSISYLSANVRSLYELLAFSKDVLTGIGVQAARTSSFAWYQPFLNETLVALRRMGNTLTVFQPMIKPNSSFLPKLFDDPVCGNAIASLTLKTTDLDQGFANFSDRFADSGSATVADDLVSRIGDALSLLDSVDNCTRQYEALLADFGSWLAGLDFSETNFTQTKVDEILVMFIDIGDWLVQLRNNYSTNSIGKKDLASILLGDSSANALQRINNVVQEITQQVVTPMQNWIDADESEATISYYQLLKYLTRIFYYTRNEEISSAARRLLIWREPIHNLEIPETTTYQLNPDEIWQVWPMELDLEAFVARSAYSRLDLICRQFFDPLHQKLSDFLSEMNNRHGQLTQAMTSLQKTLQDYIDSTNLDETFAMKNFMVIDVYYGELKYEHITQSDSYGWVNFFSDMGSFFGLLMGCSILTMFEVIDLVVYYSIVKLIERYEERPLRQEVIDIKI